MNVLFLILTAINFLVYIYAFLVDLKIIQEKKLFQTAFNKGQELGKQIEQNYNEQEYKSNKGGFIFGTIVAIILLIIFYGGVIYFPIYIGLRYNIESAISTYMAILLCTTTIRLYNYGKKADFNAKKMILMSVIVLFRFQIIILILYGFRFSLNEIIKSIYTSNFFLNNTFTVLMPILFFSTILITLYLYWTALKVNSKLSDKLTIKPRLSHLILILVLSSFTGLIYLFELDLNTSNNPGFDRIINLLTIVLASILIPSLLSIFGKQRVNDETKSDDRNLESEVIDNG